MLLLPPWVAKEVWLHGQETQPGRNIVEVAVIAGVEAAVGPQLVFGVDIAAAEVVAAVVDMTALDIVVEVNIVVVVVVVDKAVPKETTSWNWALEPVVAYCCHAAAAAAAVDHCTAVVDCCTVVVVGSYRVGAGDPSTRQEMFLVVVVVDKDSRLVGASATVVATLTRAVDS